MDRDLDLVNGVNINHHSSRLEELTIFTFEIREFMPPECTCKVEDMLQGIEHVADASVDSINGILKVKVHKGMISEDEVLKALERCGVKCGKAKTIHEKAHMEHEALEMKRKGMPMVHDHHVMMEAEMKRRFIVSLILMVPILILSPTIQGWLNFTVPRFSGYNIMLFLLATVLMIYGGIVFYRGAVKSLKLRTFDMNSLVSVAVIAGYLYSVGASFLFEGVDFYWEISTLIVFLLFGHWMEMKAIRGASGALRELIKLIPPTANVVRNGKVIELPTSELNKGDIVLVKPGGRIPIDGEVIEGSSTVNESMITGESKPVAKKVGDEVIGGAINNEGMLKFKVTKTGEETALSQIVKLVQDAQASKPRVQKIADRAAHYLTIIALTVAGLSFLFWRGFIGRETVFALTLAVTVLVIACPHALGLAIPTVTSISTTMAAKKGILIRNAPGLEAAKDLDIVVFDKTGTLTKGEFGVTDVVKVGDWDQNRILATAAAIEVNSEHVIARGIVKHAKEKRLKLPKVQKFKAIPGKGVESQVGNEEVYIGNANLMKTLGIDIAEYDYEVSALSSQGKTVVYVASKNKLQGLIGLADLIREESFEVVDKLKKLGVKAAMLTGDNRQTAEYVAEQLGLDTFFAEVLPEEKEDKIKELQSKGLKVAMVGDGINDAPALVQADVGIAIGAGTDVAVESADIVLVRNDPRDISKLINLSYKTTGKMKENLLWATGYNTIAIPAAAGALVPFNIVLRPEMAALIMAVSSIIVVANALLLKRTKL